MCFAGFFFLGRGLFCELSEDGREEATRFIGIESQPSKFRESE